MKWKKIHPQILEKTGGYKYQAAHMLGIVGKLSIEAGRRSTKTPA